jgi:hypothetical protein
MIDSKPDLTSPKISYSMRTEAHYIFVIDVQTLNQQTEGGIMDINEELTKIHHILKECKQNVDKISADISGDTGILAEINSTIKQIEQFDEIRLNFIKSLWQIAEGFYFSGDIKRGGWAKYEVPSSVWGKVSFYLHDTGKFNAWADRGSSSGNENDKVFSNKPEYRKGFWELCEVMIADIRKHLATKSSAQQEDIVEFERLQKEFATLSTTKT